MSAWKRVKMGRESVEADCIMERGNKASEAAAAGSMMLWSAARALACASHTCLTRRATAPSTSTCRHVLPSVRFRPLLGPPSLPG